MTRKMLLFGVIWLPSLALAQWSAPVNLSPNAVSAILNESMGSCIGVSGDTVHVIWADRFSSTKGAIYYTRSSDTGLVWSNPIAITDIIGNAWNPTIAVNGSNIHVVWREIDTLNQHRSSHYKHSLDGGNTWGTSVVLDTAIADWPAVAVSGDRVYVVNDIVTSASPYNTEIFFLYSSDNGATWSAHQQLTFAAGRSEDEAITAQGSHIHMSWNDNRSGKMQIFYKHSTDYGVTWGPDIVVIPPNDYGTMVSVDGAHVDVPCAGAASGHYQIHLVQSADTGATWGADMNLTNDTAHTYYYPYMVRDSNDLHLTFVKSGVGGQYLHSTDGGETWDTPYNMGYSQITPFIAYTRCVLHVIIPDSGHINYIRNPTGNAGVHCVSTTGISPLTQGEIGVKLYPNPANNKITIANNRKFPAETIFSIFNLQGEEKMHNKFRNQDMIELDVSTLKKGIYLVKIQTRAGIETKKLVIQ